MSLFLSSMNLAISLLLIIAVASVIGTLLRQNEPYQNYIIKFGPFWHEVYRSLGLYDIYSSIWFVLIMAFLVGSVSICLCRNTPRIIASARDFQLRMRAQQIASLTHHARYETTISREKLLPELRQWLAQQGYRVREQANKKNAQDTILLAAMAGRANRYGYLFTHAAIIIICAGGLLDSNFPLKLKISTGQAQIETREDIPLSAMDTRTILDEDNHSFRASVSIPEGRTVNTAFINMGAGYLIQPLPFSIHVKDFRIQHYDNGQPKSFESDLVIIDEEANLEQTILVNHPLNYRGYTIYQASFADGGSTLDFSLFDLESPTLQAAPMQLAVRQSAMLPVNGDGDALQLEISEFRRFNIFPDDDVEAEGAFRDFGPSLTFKLRQADGTAREYLNYMYPVMIDGREYLLSGVRESLQDEYRYLRIPADDDGSAKLFLAFLALLRDEARLGEVFKDSSATLLENSTLPISPADLSAALIRLVGLFLRQGFAGLQARFDVDSQADDDKAAGGASNDSAASLQSASLKMLQFALQQSYLQALEDSMQDNGEDRGLFNGQLTVRNVQFLNDSITAFSALHQYGAPYFLQLHGFQQIQASGLQITRSPGARWVYLGFALLTLGVFMLFYVSHQRLWFLLSKTDAGTQLIYGGARSRHAAEFGRYFAELSRRIKQRFAAP